ncbi:MAG: helix-turn-helix transcriptional regulator [Clostridiales bacterium]|nr:helix-turn-helix transcriptional regulator [Clostridiales bacterium]
MFAENLKMLRKEKKITQTELANHFGYSHVAILKWENGEREPNFDTLKKLADYFGVSIDYLLGHEVETQDTTISQRPDNSLSEKFASEYADLLKDNNFMDVVKLFNAMTAEYRALCLGLLIGILQKRGIDTQSILGY